MFKKKDARRVEFRDHNKKNSEGGKWKEKRKEERLDRGKLVYCSV